MNIPLILERFKAKREFEQANPEHGFVQKPEDTLYTILHDLETETNKLYKEAMNTGEDDE